mmetsp:Transcript_41915/g.64151  ORF Transcript_41915/g.64151 Transcript_41915/m.64151 type:complete len:183 (-) Transcript_41915:55-603(-)
MNTSINQQKKDYQLLHEKFKKINIVNDQISGWAKRVYGKFASLTNDAALQKQPDDLVKVFEAMDYISVSELRNLKEGQDDQVGVDDAFVDLDFATEDFINKNIRVRPISGGEDTRNEKQSNISNAVPQTGEGGAGGNNDDYDKLAVYEIEDQRKKAKKKMQDYIDEQKRKQALEEKKAAARR